MNKACHYFDNASTSHPKPDVVWKAAKQYLECVGASPGRSCYSLAKVAQDAVSHTQKLLAQLFHSSSPSSFHFTANATEALNVIIKGFLKPGDHALTTNLAHNSVLRPLERLKQQGKITYEVFNSQASGLLDLDALEKALSKSVKLMIINHGSNSLGVSCNLKRISEMCHKRGIKLLVDAAQTAGVIDINLDDIPIDFLAFTGHKALLGPPGVGGMYIRDPFCVDTLKEGGTGNHSNSLTHPESPHTKFQAGTVNYLGIAELAASLKYILDAGISELFQKKMEVTQYFMERLAELEGITIYGSRSLEFKLPIVAFNIEGLLPSEVAHILDEKYCIMVRPGVQCTPLLHKTLGTAPAGFVRVSFGHMHTHEDVDFLLKAIKEVSKSAPSLT